MIHVQFPSPDFKIKKNDDCNFIFDEIRKKWIVLTDEEWVRQNIIQYLVKTLQYPISLIAVEKEIKLNDLRKRFDILIYNTEHKPWMLIECKANDISLTQDVLHQALRYHISIPATYIIISNGISTMGWMKREEQLVAITKFPVWNT